MEEREKEEDKEAMPEQKKKFGGTGAHVPTIGQGTWMIEGDRSPAAERRAIETLRIGLDLGLTHIDTAEMYSNGRVEELVGNAIKGRRRDEVFLVSKVLPTNASYEGTLRACRQSLKRLGTDYLDLYLLHWPSGSHPIRETMRAMEKLASEGLIRFIGVSNFNVRELKAAQQALSEERIACNQVLYHLGYRAIESNLLPYCTQEQIAVVGYSPFGHRTFPPPSNNNKAKGRSVLEEIGRRHGRTIRQVTLNFLTRHPNLFTIPKTSNPEHVKENSGGMGWALTEEDVAAIERAFPAPDNNNNNNDDAPLRMI
jgi:diketogulonate reductase-like aldo/keto reductase